MKTSIRNDNYSRNFLNRIESRADFEVNSTEELFDQVFELRAFIARIFVIRDGLRESLEGNWLHIVERLESWLNVVDSLIFKVRLLQGSSAELLNEWKALINMLYDENFEHLLMLAKLSISDV
uniref:Uncharacterized protein n=1 Tax=Plectus sambesii TaxID=2011161 RepID=A0A914X072_9BILA